MAEIKCTTKKLDGDKVELEVEVPAEEVKAQVDHTIKRMARDVSVPGFRKGRVPKAVLVSRIGKEAIFSQTLHDALPKWYEQALNQTSIKAIDTPKLDFDELENHDKPFKFKATVQVPPKPKLGKYTGLEVEKEVVEVKDEEVEAPIERLQRRMAKLEKVEDRPAAKGDFVIIDYQGFVDGKPIEGGSGTDYMLELGSSSFIPGFEDGIAGMEAGQSKKLKLAFPDDYKPDELAGKKAEFNVTVKEIKERVLPELTDEFVAENSEFDTVEELRQNIRSRMTKAREAAVENLFREAVLDKATEVAEVEIPPVMIESRAEEIKKEFAMALKDSGFTIEQYAQQVGITLQELDGNFRQEAERQVKQDLTLEAIAENENLEVSDEEVEQEIKRQAERRGVDPAKLLETTRKSGREGFVRDNLRKRKALDLLAEKAIPILHKHAGPVKGEEEKPEIITP